ncbi:MAG: septation protein A [Gammaproteobacteria bacterium]|nr:septation protein A [Gammaproteobacteria bacterium]MCF6231261.1 septation protein A [Gammaproteobacteria bacterium]
MKLFNDFLPIILFFVVYKMYDIYTATAVAIVAAIVQAAFFYSKYRKLEKMHYINVGMLVLFGGATLLFQNEAFIMWKPTVINWLLAAVLLGSHFIGEKTVMQRLMGSALTLPQTIWSRINISWILFFLLSGALNIYVAFNYDTDTWVNFKLFGMLGITVVFMIAQGLYLSRYLKEEPPPLKSEE